MSGPFGSTAWMANPASGFYGHEIDNSVRFETTSNGHLTHTLGTAANLRTNTTSFWLKRSKLGVSTRIFASGASLNSNFDNSINIIITSGDLLQLYQETGNNNTVINLITTQVFRDTSAWYHIVFAIDTTQGTNTNRVKLYVNGIQVTSFGTATYPSENLDTHIFSAEIRRWARGQSSAYADVQLAQIAQISGVQHAISDLGELKNDIWIPKDITGLTYAAGSYLLELKNSGVGTASSSTVGADTSGNTLHFTSSGLAVHDHLPDSPTNNFATFNHVDSSGTLAEGNLKFSDGTGSGYKANSTIVIPDIADSQKYYVEFVVDQGYICGIIPEDITGANNNAVYDVIRGYYPNNGKKYTGTSASSYGASFGTGNQMGMLIGNGTLEFFKDSASQGNAFTSLTGAWKIVCVAFGNAGAGAIFNFGQDSSFAGAKTAQGETDANGIGDFYYDEASSGLALCTANLPDPVATIDPNKGGSVQDYFDTVLYTAATSNGTFTHGDLEFQPDWSWIKCRSDGERHFVADVVRGNTSITDKWLVPNEDSAEGANSTTGTTFSVTATGYQFIESSIGNDELYFNNRNYVGWNWKAGTSFSNDASSTSVGTIDSAGSVNTDVGFSIIGYTGTGSNATVAHGLNSAPDVVLVKGRSNGSRYWSYWGTQFASTSYIYLNVNTAEDTGATSINQDTYPSSSVFSIGNSVFVNGSSETYIAYCFHSVDGYSKFGKYTGNANTNGPFVYTGFRPAWLMVKNISASASWWIVDCKRPGFNGTLNSTGNTRLRADTTGVEDDAGRVDTLSNGFKIRTPNYAESNTNGATYIYMAFAEQPFKYANAR